MIPLPRTRLAPGAGPVTKLPLRLFGFGLLAVTLSLASCQSVWHSVATTAAPLIERASD